MLGPPSRSRPLPTRAAAQAALRRRTAAGALLACVVLAGCGGEDGGQGRPDGARGGSFEATIRGARAAKASDFPRPGGRTLKRLARTLPAVDAGLATSVFTPGSNRLAFGIIDRERRFVYGRTAVYVARSPDAEARGPFVAKPDPLVVEPAFRSRGAATAGDDIAAIYEAHVDLPTPGTWYVLAVTKAQGMTYGAAAQVAVARSSPIPARGEPAPEVATDTRASAAGDIESIDTRVPPDDMHERSFDQVVGRKPVALLFATPALCESRVCGPVVDIAAQLKKEYGRRIEFIHQEVYAENEPAKGFRPPLRAFKLRTEPWLFTVDGRGRIAARLEGSFGNGAFRRALEAALSGGS